MFEELIANAMIADRERVVAQLQLHREALRFKKSRTHTSAGRPSLALPRRFAWLRFSRT